MIKWFNKLQLKLTHSQKRNKNIIYLFLAKVALPDILPFGNVAHGLVYNYFAGFLRHILPGKCIKS